MLVDYWAEFRLSQTEICSDHFYIIPRLLSTTTFRGNMEIQNEKKTQQQQQRQQQQNNNIKNTTQFGFVTPYGDKNLGHYWLS